MMTPRLGGKRRDRKRLRKRRLVPMCCDQAALMTDMARTQMETHCPRHGIIFRGAV